MLFTSQCFRWRLLRFIAFLEMARGQQKLQSQAKAAEKTNKLKKQQGHSAQDQKKAAQKALVHLCFICKVCNPILNILLSK